MSTRVPFLVWVPAIVVVLGLMAAALIALLGASELADRSEEAAALRSRAVATTLAQRVASSPNADHARLLDNAARRTNLELVLIKRDGTVLHDATNGTPSQVGLAQLASVGQGETTTSRGHARFHAAPVPNRNLVLLCFTTTPDEPQGRRALLQVVGLFTLVLLGIGALAAYALAREVHSDITYVTGRIVKMAEEEGPVGTPVTVRTLDQVGVLTNAFNDLVRRFNEAGDAYKADLSGALAYERERGEFLAALSHELRTPLNVILGFTDVLLSEVDGPLSAEARENLDVVRQSGQHLRSLINDILDLSALESGEMRLSRLRCDVMQVASEVVRETRVTAEKKGLSLDLLGTPAVAEVDPVRVRQIISNLLGNAVKFTTNGGVIVTVSRLEESVRIAVSDTGPGIAAAEQAAIFEEYQQVGDPRTQPSGAGLGLAITRRLVKMHGGTVKIDSVLGQGAVFTVTLPVVAPEPVVPSRSYTNLPALGSSTHAVPPRSSPENRR